MTDPLIRKAKPGDESGIHEAHMRSIREICVKDHGVEEIKGWGYRQLGDRWKEPIKAGTTWVVEVNNTIHGLAYVRIYNDSGINKANLHALYLTPEIAGKGFGKKLANLVLEESRKANASSITLASSITAHGFYMKLGFKGSGPKVMVDIGGYPVTSFPMILELK